VAVGFALNVLLLGSVSWGRGERARTRRVSSIATVALIVANAVVLVIWLSPVRRARIDLTQDGAYSLSDATRNIVGNLDQQLLIRGYFSEKSHPDVEPLVPQLRDLLEEYRVVGGGKVKVEIIDPTDDDEAKRDAKERFDIQPQPIENVTSSQRAVVNAYFAIAIQYGDQHEVLGLFDLIQVRQLGTDKPDIKLRNSEYQITRSIKKVVASFQSIDSLFASAPGKVKITTYITPDSLPDNLKEAPAKLKKVLDEIGKDAGGKLEVASVAPKGESEMLELYRKYGIRPFQDILAGKTYYYQILIEIGGRLVRLQPPDTLGDAALKTAIIDGLKRGAPGFTRVVGMWVPQAPQMPDQMGMGRQMPPPQSFQRLRQALAGNYEVRDVVLSTRIPDDIDVVLLCGPAHFDAKAVETIDQFVMRGGALVVLAGRFRLAPAEGLAIERVSTGLEKMFEAWGITVDDKLVLDTKSDTFPVPRARDVGGGMLIREFQQVAYPFFPKVDGDRLASSIITGGIPGSVVHFAAPITVKDKVGDDARTIERLLVSSDDSWLSTSLSVELDPDKGFPQPVDGKRESHALAVSIVGGFSSAVAKKPGAGSGSDAPVPGSDASARLAEHSPPDARIVVFGSSVFVSDALLGHAEQFDQGLALSNVQLVHNAVDWAFADTDLLAIRAQGTGAHALTLDADKREKWRIINAIIALVLLAGVIGFAQVRRRAVAPVIGQDGKEAP
jgi:ABC-2 type transport system permease protein